MSAMSLVFGLVAAAFITVVGVDCFAQDSRPVRYTAVVLEGRTQGGVEFKLAIRTRAFAESESREKRYWGTDGWEPDRLILDLSLMAGTVSVKVPDSAVADLADPTLPAGVFLTEKDGRILVHIKGGDGTGSYEAVLETCEGSVSARRISYFNPEGEFVTDREEFSKCVGKKGVAK